MLNTKVVSLIGSSNVFSQILSSGLYIVSTPLGNLKDLTQRALETLGQVDLVLCEDTRISRTLMQHYNISTPLRALHDHNEAQMVPFVIDQLQQQKKLALISDAGTPLISDPGYKIVRAVIEHNYFVTALPGPSAVINALVLSGLPNHQFFFNGFLSAKILERRQELQKLSVVSATLIFYESCHRLQKTLEMMMPLFKHREIVVIREMTKKFEEVVRGSCSTVIDHFNLKPPRGEIVVLVSPPVFLNQQWDEHVLEEELRQSLQHQSLKAAVEEMTLLSGLSKKIVYQKALMLAKDLK